MNSLVSAAYGSSSSEECQADDDYNKKQKPTHSTLCENIASNLLESSSDIESDDSEDTSNQKQTDFQDKKPVLPSASAVLLKGNTNAGQVFNNPYKKAEIEHIASLEKHVKMVNTDAHTQMKNGRKICWNYRKGRCRFGSNCTYAHDSDLHTGDTNAMHQTAEQTQSTPTPNTSNFQMNPNKSNTSSRRKRPGLGDSIVPSKKVIKSYNALNKS